MVRDTATRIREYTDSVAMCIDKCAKRIKHTDSTMSDELRMVKRELDEARKLFQTFCEYPAETFENNTEKSTLENLRFVQTCLAKKAGDPSELFRGEMFEAYLEAFIKVTELMVELENNHSKERSLLWTNQE